VITAGVAEGRPYLVMRYCPPPDLGVRVAMSPMSVPDAISTGIKLASAVETAHRHGIVHRDIKPSNVLVTTYHEPALSDFGIVGHLHDLAGDDEMRISYPWSPPELLDGRSNGSVGSDVYSLGATIWNLLVGRSPFSVPDSDNSSRAITARILHSPAPSTQRPDVPPALDQLLQQCLAKDPGHRPQSAFEVALALQRIEADTGFSRTPVAVAGDRLVAEPPLESAHELDATQMKPIAIRPGSGPRPASTGSSHPSTPPSRTAWIMAGVLVVVVVCALLIVNGLSGDDRPAPPSTGPSSNTPQSLIPESVTEPPVVTGARRGKVVRFTWRAADRAQNGDTWEWKRTDTGQTRRTPEAMLSYTSPERTCLQVRLIRGSSASPWSETCVD